MIALQCDLCKDKLCYKEEKDCYKLEESISDIYKDDDLRCSKVAAQIEADYYMQKTRVEELILFSQQMGYKRLGVAFCLGLQDEAKTLCSYLRKYFKISSVCCKICGSPKSKLNLPQMKQDQLEIMCNPIIQAQVLKAAKTELNVLVGLCMGHDVIFNKHSHVPTTTLIVKYRVLSHNPAGALYTFYYKRKLG